MYIFVYSGQAKVLEVKNIQYLQVKQHLYQINQVSELNPN